MQIVPPLSFQVGFLVAFHGNSLLVEGVLISLVAHDRIPVIEINAKLPRIDPLARYLHINAE